ncbi:ADPribosylglycohydrolase superfamily protein [Pelomyxa schiedti]|nr:ADPribosylglycohydrolase superfamily protein [Pelomyxa schiedti]
MRLVMHMDWVPFSFSLCLELKSIATEFCTKEWVNDKFHGSQIPFPDFPRTAHSVRWTLGDWTDDTDQLILILQGILETGGTVSETNFAMKLIHWIKQGFPELGDTADNIPSGSS